MSGSSGDRRNWTRSLSIVGLIAVAGLIISGLVDVDDEKIDRRFFKNTAGAVLFDHDKHSQFAESCAQCHHDLYSADMAVGCMECHDDEFDLDEFSHESLKEYHSRNCSTCHDQAIDESEAASCRECHPGVQPAESFTLSCMECHDDEYTPEIMSHDEYLEIEEHSCQECHTPRAISETYHTNCSACHLETAQDRFTDSEGELLCGACHLR